MFTDADRRMMALAVQQAELALDEGEVPVGAVIVKDGEPVCAARNTRETQNDPAGHAEINALRGAAKRLGTWRLTGCTLYVTLEPCCMCAGAIVQAGVDRVIFGAYDEQAGCCGSLYRITEDPAFPHFVRADGGLMAEECGELLKEGMKRARRAEL